MPPPETNFMLERYSRNFPYITEQEQELIANTRILLAGTGLGSVIAESLVRTGFTNLVLIDGDDVELSNLNRQNFTVDRIGQNKAKALFDYLKTVDPDAKLEYHALYLNTANLKDYIERCDIVINTIDFENGAFIECNRVARECKKPLLFPMNFGWAGFVYLFRHDTKRLEPLLESHPDTKPQIAVLLKLVQYLMKRNQLPLWFFPAWERYQTANLPYEPQLHIGSNTVASLVTSVAFDLATGRSVPVYPEPLFHDNRSYTNWPVSFSGALRELWVRFRDLHQFFK